MKPEHKALIRKLLREEADKARQRTARLMELQCHADMVSVKSMYKAEQIDSANLAKLAEDAIAELNHSDFPVIIKEPVPLRDYGALYLVKDAYDGFLYITTREDWFYRSKSDKIIEEMWTVYVHNLYPEARNHS